MAIPVEIVTPEKVVSHVDVDSLVVPAWDGELGILPHHAPLLAELQPGEIRLRAGGSLELLAVSGGFVQVRANRVTIFAETAELAQEIDVERARQAAERAKQLVKTSRTDQDLAAAETALRRALVRLQTSEHLRRHPKPSYR